MDCVCFVEAGAVTVDPTSTLSRASWPPRAAGPSRLCSATPGSSSPAESAATTTRSPWGMGWNTGRATGYSIG